MYSNKKYKKSAKKFFDGIDRWAKDQGASGMAYFTLEKDQEISAKGPVGKFFKESLLELMKKTNAEIGDSIFFACNKEKEINRITALARDKIANELNLIDENILLFNG